MRTSGTAALPWVESPQPSTIRTTSFSRCLAHPWAGPAVLAATCFISLFLGLGDYHLFDPDEARSAEVAREMLATGQWLVPTINFGQFHDKPAFYYWLIAGSIRLFGSSDFAVRLPGAVAAAITVVATGAWAAYYLGRSTGQLAALILMTTLGFVGMGRIVLTDATFSCWVVTALFYGGAYWMERAREQLPAWPFFLLISLATLTKGPAAIVLALLVFLPLGWLTQRPLRLRKLELLQGALILLVIVGGWYASAALAAPEYIWNFLWNHNVRRYARGGGGHSANALTFLYLLPAAYLPWSLYFPATVASLVRTLRKEPLAPPLVFCIVWVAVVVGFFSLGGSKLVTYVLPAFPPLAVLVANAVAVVAMRDEDANVPASMHQNILRVLCALSVIGAIALLVFLRHVAPHRLILAACPLAALAPLILAIRSVARGHHSAALAAVGIFTLLNAGFYFCIIAPTLDDAYSFAEPAQMIRAAEQPSTVYAYKTFAYSLEYYAETPTHEVKNPVEAAKLLSGDAPVVLLTRGRYLDTIRRLTTSPWNVWWQGSRSRVLLSNRSAPSSFSPLARDVLAFEKRTR